PGQARGLEAVIHPENVQAHDLMRVALAGAEAVGEIDDPLRLDVEHGAHHVLELRDVAANDRRADRHAAERRRAGIQVHADDLLAARHEAPDETRADEAGRADHQYRHGATPAWLTARRSCASRPRTSRTRRGSGP